MQVKNGLLEHFKRYSYIWNANMGLPRDIHTDPANREKGTRVFDISVSGDEKWIPHKGSVHFVDCYIVILLFIIILLLIVPDTTTCYSYYY
jgi:hypothetical protein